MYVSLPVFASLQIITKGRYAGSLRQAAVSRDNENSLPASGAAEMQGSDMN
jgi:hypothetical protein